MMHVLVVIIVVLGALWFIGWIEDEQSETMPETRERIIARVLLHEARRNRELAELERRINDRADRRLAELQEKLRDP